MVEKYDRAFGPDKRVAISATGGTSQQRKSLEAEIAAGIINSSRESTSGPAGFFLVMSFDGDLQELAGKVRTGKVVEVDAASRTIKVELP